jgi:hypothetical protein
VRKRLIETRRGKNPHVQEILRSYGISAEEIYVEYRRYYVTDTQVNLRPFFNDVHDRYQFLSKVLYSELDETEKQLAEIRITLDNLAQPKVAQPMPQVAERLLSYLLSPDRLEEAIGDVEDGYNLIFERHGAAQARPWYWLQVLKIGLSHVFNLVSKIVRIWAS